MFSFACACVIILLTLDYSAAAKLCKVPNGNAGTCLPLDKCTPMHVLSKKSKSQEEDRFLRQSVGACSGGGAKIKVCCPQKAQWENLVLTPVAFPEAPVGFKVNKLSHNNPTTTESVVPRINTPTPYPVAPDDEEDDDDDEDVNSHQNLKQYKCGVEQSNSDKIRGGLVANIDDYPWLVLLEYQPNQFGCGGSLISDRFVLTAAHCLYGAFGKPNNVRLSEYNTSSYPTDTVETNGRGFETITVEIVSVQWAAIHPQHVCFTYTNDIGLVKMSRNVQFSDFILSICLPARDYTKDFNPKVKLVVAGWGSDGVREHSSVKKYVKVPFVPLEQCKKSFFDIQEGQHLCAGGEAGKDSCRGDSGGPLMYEDTLFTTVVGIVSSGKWACGSEGHPGIYTYVYSYMGWINEIMQISDLSASNDNTRQCHIN